MLELPESAATFDWLLESPWKPMIGLIVLAVVAMSLGASGTLKRGFWAGLGLLAAAAALWVAARFVETDAERMERRTRELVAAALEGDAEAVGGLLADDLLVVIGPDETRLGRQGILDRVPALPALVASNNVRRVEAVVIGDGRGESVLEQTTGTALGVPTPNGWRLVWKRDDDRWRIAELRWELINLNDVPRSSMIGQ